MSEIRNGYTPGALYNKDMWPDVDKVPIDEMYSSCAAGILANYTYNEDPFNTIKCVVKAIVYGSPKHVEIQQEAAKDGKYKNLYSFRRTNLFFADGGDYGPKRGRALAAYIEKHKLGVIVGTPDKQNLMYAQRQHPCAAWVWQPDYEACEKHVASKSVMAQAADQVKALF
jgi:hypothetical protein